MPEIPCPLTDAAHRWPDRPALICGDSTLTYLDLNQQANRYAAHLQQQLDSLPHHRRLGLILDNSEHSRSLNTVLLLWASFRLGLTAIPIDSRLPAALISSVVTRENITPLYLGSKPSAPLASALPWEAPLDSDSPHRHVTDANPRWILESEATGILTSGSTGEPKLCVHSFGNHYYSALGSNENLPLGPGDYWLLSLPLYHVGGLAIFFRASLAGAAVVIADNDQDLKDSIANYRITHCSMVPTQLRRFLGTSGGRDDLKAVLIGGAAPPRPLIESAYDRGLPIFTSYGLTEMASQVTTTAPNAPLPRLLTSGQILPHRELMIDGSSEILVRGKTLCLGYLDNNTLLPPTDADGWFHTGDVGELDADGYLHVSGRRDTMFISGGENIYPEMIERALLDLPDITEVVVVTVDDDEYGQRPFAFINMIERNPRDYDRSTHLVRDYILITNGRADTPAQVKEMLKNKLPPYAIPVRIAPIPDNTRQGLKPDRPYLSRLARELYKNKT